MCEEKQIMKIYKNERLGKCKNVKGNAKLKVNLFPLNCSFISECSSVFIFLSTIC